MLVKKCFIFKNFILMILCRNVEQDKTTCQVQEWQLWLSYFWSYLPVLCLNLISCLLCNTNTLWNILMILGRNIEQDEMKCCIQDWQLLLSYFWSYLHFLCLNLISCLLSNSNTLHNILMILCRNVEQTRWHVTYKNNNSGGVGWWGGRGGGGEGVVRRKFFCFFFPLKILF